MLGTENSRVRTPPLPAGNPTCISAGFSMTDLASWASLITFHSQKYQPRAFPPFSYCPLMNRRDRGSRGLRAGEFPHCPPSASFRRVTLLWLK